MPAAYPAVRTCFWFARSEDSNSCGGDRRLRRKQGAEAGAAVAEAAARPRGASRCGHRNPYSARRPLRRAKRLLRSYAGVCLQGLVIALACIIFSALATSAPAVNAGNSAITAVWSYVGTLAFNLLVRVGAVKGCDRIVKGDHGGVRVLLFVGFLWYNCVTRRWLVCLQSFPSVI